MTRAMQISRLAFSAAALAFLFVLWGCGGSGDAEVQPTATMAEPPTVPAATPIPTMDTSVEVQPTSTIAEPPTVPAATAVPTQEPVDPGEATGKYEGVTYAVSDGSEATFTVEEQLVRLPLPNDAVMRTTELSGEVHLDGRPSVVRIDLQSLESDQAFRDRYVRTRMFGEYPTGTFTVPDIGPVPQGLAAGEEVMTDVSGSLEMRGESFPLEFEIEARDDGDVLYVLGRTTFTWDQLNIPRPTAPTVASVEDDVRVEILLALTAEAPALLQDVTLRQLYEESVANLARYDALYKGKWFLVTGTVDYMFDYQIVVDVAPDDGDVKAVLRDVPHSDQIPLDNGDPIAARCRIGDVIGYGVYMENCSLE